MKHFPPNHRLIICTEYFTSGGKNYMNKKKALMGLFLSIIAASQVACSNQGIDKAAKVSNEAGIVEDDSKGNDRDLEREIDNQDLLAEDAVERVADHDTQANNMEKSDGAKADIDDEAIMKSYREQINTEDSKISDIMSYLEKNISLVSKGNASTMLLLLEELQVKKRTVLEEKFLPEEIQIGFWEAYQKGVDYTKPEALEEEVLKNLVQETVEYGYKLEQAEGFVFPVIDYTLYDRFTTYATPDIADYFKIMAEQSEKPYAKDAALVIGWEDLINRALSTEEFLKNHPSSNKAADIEVLHQWYSRATFFGLNNTPLFDYETKIMVDEAKEVYQKYQKEDRDSEYLTKLEGFMEVLAENNFKLTAEVEEYRNNLIK